MARWRPGVDQTLALTTSAPGRAGAEARSRDEDEAKHAPVANAQSNSKFQQ